MRFRWRYLAYGDGSFQFGVQALWSAVRYEVPIGIVIFRNGQYQANRKFLDAYGKRAAATGKYIGVSLGSPDIDNVSIAKRYGVEGEHVESPDELTDALDRCLFAVADGRPYLLDVAIERHYGGADSGWYDFFSVARNVVREQSLAEAIKSANAKARDGASAREAGDALGTSGFVIHSVPMATYAFVRFGSEPVGALTELISAVAIPTRTPRLGRRAPRRRIAALGAHRPHPRRAVRTDALACARESTRHRRCHRATRSPMPCCASWRCTRS